MYRVFHKQRKYIESTNLKDDEITVKPDSKTSIAAHHAPGWKFERKREQMIFSANYKTQTKKKSEGSQRNRKKKEEDNLWFIAYAIPTEMPPNKIHPHATRRACL